MEPVSLSIVVAALVAKALNRAEDETLDEAGSALGRLVGAVRRRLAGGTAEDRAALAGVEIAPDSPKQVQRLTAALERQAEDKDFQEELQRLVEETDAAGVPVGSIVQSAIGSDIVQIGNATSSTISVNIGK
jgi:Sec-independent protein translocase protein TatA